MFVSICCMVLLVVLCCSLCRLYRGAKEIAVSRSWGWRSSKSKCDDPAVYSIATLFFYWGYCFLPIASWTYLWTLMKIPAVIILIILLINCHPQAVQSVSRLLLRILPMMLFPVPCSNSMKKLRAQSGGFNDAIRGFFSSYGVLQVIFVYIYRASAVSLVSCSSSPETHA